MADVDDDLTQSLAAPTPAAQAGPVAAPDDELSQSLAAAPSRATPQQNPPQSAMAAPAAEPDYASMPAGDVFRAGVKNIPASAVSTVGNLGAAASGAARGMLDTGDLPGAGLVRAGDAWVDKNVPGAHWLNDKLGYQGPQNDAEYRQAVQPLNDIAQNYKDRYGSTAAFKKTWATDPVGVGLDVASVVDPALRVGRAAGLVGKAADVAAPVSEAELGAHFSDAAAASKGAVDSAYGEAYHTPGTFDPNVAAPIGDEALKAVTSEPGFPKDWDELSRSNHLPQTKAALLNLQDHLQNIGPQGIDMPGLENVRRSLRSFANDASGTDRHYVNSLIDGFDSGVTNAASTPGLFSGNGPSAVQAMQDARDANVAHINNFGSQAPNAVRAAMNALPDDLSNATPGHFQQAGVALRRGLLNEGTGAQLHSHLTGVGVPEPALNGFLQERLLSGTPKAVGKNLQNPVAQRAFGDELPRAQNLVAQSGSSTFGQRVRPVAGALADAGLTGLGATHGPVGAVMGHFAKKGLERVMPGAASQTSLFDQFVNPPPSALSSIARGAVAAGAKVNPANAYGRAEHARGGKVGHQHLVDRMFREVEKAKRAEKGRTSVLLHQPDEAVAKALNVAQAAI